MLYGLVCIAGYFFRKARDKVLIEGLHFPDSRAEALTRRSRKVDVMTLAKISGRKDLSILQNTSYRESAEDIAARLWPCAVACADCVPVTASNELVTVGHVPTDALVTPQPEDPQSDVVRLAAEIAAGRVRATVSDIRRYRGCSQAKATALRRQFSESVMTE
jgi:hypothetical protein